VITIVIVTVIVIVIVAVKMTPIKLLNYFATTSYNHPEYMEVTQKDDNNLQVNANILPPNKQLSWNINFDELLRSEECQNGMGVWTLTGFARKDFQNVETVITPPLQNELKRYYHDNFLDYDAAYPGPIENNPVIKNIGYLFVSEQEKILSLVTNYVCIIKTNIRYKRIDLHLAEYPFFPIDGANNGYFMTGSITDNTVANPLNKPSPFKLNYKGPTEVSGNNSVNLTFDVEFQNLDLKPWSYGDYNKLYAVTDKGTVDTSCVITNNSGSLSFSAANMNVGDTANVRIGAHWFYISEVFQITKTS